ncbi:glycosyltransferase [Novosphingobium bradum]|uniref:Glycosyltransferase n=1 Tax=Novosphingobium bradum TaxID=1737444 RepID=A0ABV7IKQ4_9SPHN
MRQPRRIAAALALARLALMADPAEALKALASLARGKRQRGRTMLNRAASCHPGYYAAWIRHGEPRALAAWLGSAEAGGGTNPPPRIGIVAPGPDADRAVAALGRLGVALVPGNPAEVLAEAERTGCDWLLPLPAGCRLSPHLARVLPLALAAPCAPVVYWDHDLLENGRRGAPVLKPDWDPLLQREVDLLGGASVVRCDRAAAVLAEGGADTADLGALRLAVALQGDAGPLHLPLILSHQPCVAVPATPVADEGAADGPLPGISILIPTRDRADLLEACLAGLARLVYPGPVEIFVIDNDSVEPATHALFARLVQSGQARIVGHPGPFNFAAMINHGARAASHDLLCLLNNDIEPLDGHWLGRMAVHALVPRVGAVGAQLLYPDGTVQHAGIALGIGGAAGHVAKGALPGAAEHRIWHSATRRVSAVTAACLVVERGRFEAVGGMDEERFAVDFNDVDLCLRLQRAGYENRVVSEAALIHHESKSRGTRRTGADLVRFEGELHNLQAIWQTKTCRDPWFHPLFRKDSQECLLQF